MTYYDLLLSSVNNAQHGMTAEQAAAVNDAIGLADSLFPVVAQAVSEAAATDENKRSLLRRPKSVTLAAGIATLTDDVLTKYIVDATLIDPASLTKKYAWRDYPDFVRRGDRRLGVFSLQGVSLLVIEPNAGFAVPLVATGARTLTIPCCVVKPAAHTDDVDCPDAILSDLDEALSDTLRGEIARVAGARA